MQLICSQNACVIICDLWMCTHMQSNKTTIFELLLNFKNLREDSISNVLRQPSPALPLQCSAYRSLSIIVLWKKEAMNKQWMKATQELIFTIKNIPNAQARYYKLSIVFHVLKCFSNSRIASMATFIELNNQKVVCRKKWFIMLCFSVLTLDSILPGLVTLTRKASKLAGLRALPSNCCRGDG